jgi:alpha-N-arabinofuranosidase
MAETTINGTECYLFGLAGSASLQGRTLALTVVSPHIGEPVEATIELCGDAAAVRIRETVLTHADIHAHNTLENPDTVRLSAPRLLFTAGKNLPQTFAPQSVTRLDMVLG